MKFLLDYYPDKKKPLSLKGFFRGLAFDFGFFLLILNIFFFINNEIAIALTLGSIFVVVFSIIEVFTWVVVKIQSSK
ncbi:MAG: hypothetical protein K2Q26_04445 [Bdellovibrionales bacterium]|nr:hypothetical protein [Bdellovibrionales bacterium]